MIFRNRFSNVTRNVPGPLTKCYLENSKVQKFLFSPVVKLRKRFTEKDPAKIQTIGFVSPSIRDLHRPAARLINILSSRHHLLP